MPEVVSRMCAEGSEGSAIFEEARALDVEEGDPCRVITGTGVIRARSVRADASKDPHGMYISVGEPARSVHTAPAADGLPAGVRLLRWLHIPRGTRAKAIGAGHALRYSTGRRSKGVA